MFLKLPEASCSEKRGRYFWCNRTMCECSAELHQRGWNGPGLGSIFTIPSNLCPLSYTIGNCTVSIKFRSCLIHWHVSLYEINSLRMPPELSNDGVLEDVKKCAEILKDLEFRWSGAKRSRAIIEQLLLHHGNTAAHVTSVNHDSNDAIPPPKVLRGSKRPFDDFEDTVSSAPENENLVWGDVPGSEIFHFDPLDPFLFTSWNGWKNAQCIKTCGLKRRCLTSISGWIWRSWYAVAHAVPQRPRRPLSGDTWL